MILMIHILYHTNVFKKFYVDVVVGWYRPKLKSYAF